MSEDTGNESSPTVAALQAQIQALNSLAERVASLRRAPAALLRPSNGSMPLGAAKDALSATLTGVPMTLTDVLTPPSVGKGLRDHFDQIKDVNATIMSEEMQATLKAASESEKADSTGLASQSWRLGQFGKRRRQPSPESPLPYIRPKTASTWPPLSDSEESASSTHLLAYARGFNQKHGTEAKLSVWRPTKSSTVSAKRKNTNEFGRIIILRLSILGVLVAFITLENVAHDRPLVIENVTCFGPREKKPPHVQSDWLVYQKISQEIAKLIRAQSSVSLQQLMDLMVSFKNVFTASCSRCGQLLRTEDHMPPILRVWVEEGAIVPAGSALVDGKEDHKAGRWEPCHPDCARS